MGAYLSEPVTEKVSSDEANNTLECGSSSMQGWRVNQEDAHNTILDYDTNMSLFAVYDGHGGAEVATYCSQNLPNFIKNTEAYKKGDLIKALEDAFLQFDATIATKEVMDVLKELAGEINPPGPSDNEDSDDDNVSNLYQEARLPLQEVLAKYESKWSSLHRQRLGDTATPMSPCLRAKKNTSEPATSGCGASSSGFTFAAGSSSGQIDDAASSSKEESSALSKEEDAGGVSSTDSKDVNGEVSTSEEKAELKGATVSFRSSTAVPDSSEDNGHLPEQSGDACTSVPNGEVAASKQAEGEQEEGDITSSNGNTTPVKKTKERSPESSTDKQAVRAPDRPTKSKVRRAAALVYESLLRSAGASAGADDDSDSNDENFEGGELDSSDEDKANGVDCSSNEGEGEGEDNDEEEECEEESSEEEEEGEEGEEINLSEEPGDDSGCTAVVALLAGKDLYVANAGDSRCIICREGKAIDMSIDHKPEDLPELERITKAGGKVSSDGRINSGLNLSRAIGDHSYKRNKELSAKEQMITAFPDVKHLKIDPDKDQFMVLACDGIWNFMSSQDVCDFIVPRLAEGRERVSQICEEMFDHCLAPSTMGDGTGCDNMTCIIVRFKGAGEETSRKRAADEQPGQEEGDAGGDGGRSAKRQKVDEPSLSSSVVTSSG